MESNLILHSTDEDIKYFLFEHELISQQIQEHGNWNFQALKICDKILKNSTYGEVIDVGAGIGSFSIPLSLYNKNKFKFTCFEPIQTLFYQLCANILLNRIDDVISSHRNIISNEQCTKKFETLNFETSNNHGSFSFIPEYNKKRNIRSHKQEMYETRKLDSYNITNVKLIKISVSGMENLVLDGAVETIRNSNLPPVAIQSWEEPWFKEERENTVKKMKGLQYGFSFSAFGYMFFFKDEFESEQLRRDVQVTDTLGKYKMVETDYISIDEVLENQSNVGARLLNSI